MTAGVFLEVLWQSLLPFTRTVLTDVEGKRGHVIFLFLSPSLFDLPEITLIFTYALGFIHLILTTTTTFEFRIFKIIPFRIHGIIA